MADKELEELEKEALAELEQPEENQGEEEPQDEELPEVEEEEEVEDKQDDESSAQEADEQADNVDEEDSGEEVAEPEEEDDHKEPENEYGIKIDKPVKIKSKNLEVEIKDPKELIELAHKGFDYFKKTQELAKWRNDIKIIEEGGISKEELMLLKDIKSGNKEAVAKMFEVYGLDPLEIEPESAANYQQTHTPEVDPHIDSIIEAIQSEPEHAAHFSRVAQAVPDDFLNEVASDPVKLMHFNDHVKKGIADKVVPEALKAQMLYGGSFMDHYTRIGAELLANEQQQPQGQQMQKKEPQVTQKEKELRRKATTPKRGGSRKTSFIKDAESIWDLPEEEFLKLTAKDLER